MSCIPEYKLYKILYTGILATSLLSVPMSPLRKKELRRIQISKKNCKLSKNKITSFTNYL